MIESWDPESVIAATPTPDAEYRARTPTLLVERASPEGIKHLTFRATYGDVTKASLLCLSIDRELETS